LTLNNNKIWTATDGSQGMRSQANGLAKEFNKEFFEIKTDLIFPWSKLQPGFIPPFKWIFKNKIPNQHIPKILITCGRKSIYLSIFLKNKFKNMINIHIQNPKCSLKKFNFIIIPNHDNVTASNVITSTGAIHQFDLKNLSITNNFNIPCTNLVSCIIGGENQHYKFGERQAINLCDELLKIIKYNNELNLLIITSRRTDHLTKQIINNKFKGLATIWSGSGENPYEFAIKNSSFFILTSDSTSMISETAISGKPVYIYQLPFKRISKRFERFHDEFKNLNITRDLNNLKTLKIWKYKPLNETKRIAGIIKKRIIEEHL